MVAGQHDHADAGSPGLRHGIGDPVAQRIGEPHQAQPGEGEALHGGGQGGGIVVPRGSGDGQHAQAPASHRLDVCEHRGTLCGGGMAEVGHGFRRALAGHEHAVAALPGVGHRGAGGRQRVFAQQHLRWRAIRGGGRVQCRGGLVQGAVHGVDRIRAARQHARVEQRAQVGRQRRLHAAALCAGHQLGDRHAVAGEGAGLVGAQHGDRAQRLDRRGAPDQGLVPRHPPRAQREEHREHHREFFRDGGDRQGQAGQDRVRQSATACQEQSRDEHRGGQRQAGEQQHHAADFPLHRRRFHVQAAQRDADLADLGTRAGGGDFGHAVSSHHQRAGMDQRLFAGAIDPTPQRHGFAAQQRFVDLEVDGLQQARVRGHPVALGEEDDVTHHQFAGGQQARAAIAQRACTWAPQFAQGLQRAFGLLFLVDRQADHRQHRQCEQQGFPGVAQHQVERGGGQQEQQHRFAHHAEHDRPVRTPFGLRQGIGAIAQVARAGLHRRQARPAPGWRCRSGVVAGGAVTGKRSGHVALQLRRCAVFRRGRPVRGTPGNVPASRVRARCGHAAHRRHPARRG